MDIERTTERDVTTFLKDARLCRAGRLLPGNPQFTNQSETERIPDSFPDGPGYCRGRPGIFRGISAIDLPSDSR